MCGIVGMVGWEGGTDPGATLRAMTTAMAHRGPDAEGHWWDEEFALGHRRLGIIDLGRENDQPFQDAEGRYVLVYNGEIYNYRALREELRTAGLTFRTSGDTEVLLRAYQHWGADCLHRLEGMFAFAILDRGSRSLFIARDRLGIKPLYMHHGHGSLVFASELRALLASGSVPRRLDHDSLVDHLRHQTVHGSHTILRDVHMLPPGHWMRVDATEVEQGRWWHPVHAARQDVHDLPRATVLREVADLLGRAVEKRLVADVPFGAFLSGGIDSSAVVGLMAQASSAPVHTFTVTFDESEHSEARYAAIIAKRFRTEHTEIRLRPADMLLHLPEALAAMDHPSADGPNTWIVSRATRQAGITMALSGLGGDEVFAGYAHFQRTLWLWERRWITQFPRGLRRLAGFALRKARPGVASNKAAALLALPSFSVDDTYPIARLAFTDGDLRGLLCTGTFPFDRVQRITQDLLRREDGAYLPLLSQVSVAEMSTYLPDVLLRDTDQMSMAHALEVRVPFLDHDLVSYVLGVSDASKYPHTPKRLLTDALGDLLPRSIIDRPKMGFTLPWAAWMRGELRSFCALRLEALAERPAFKPDGIRTLWKRFLAGDPRVTWSRVWQLVVLEDWLGRHGVEN